jgi:hypothetical protein
MSQCPREEGFFMKRLLMEAITHMMKRIIIGVTPSISATKGAKIVTVLENKLQKPIDYTVKRVGNMTELPR